MDLVLASPSGAELAIAMLQPALRRVRSEEGSKETENSQGRENDEFLHKGKAAARIALLADQFQNALFSVNFPDTKLNIPTFISSKIVIESIQGYCPKGMKPNEDQIQFISSSPRPDNPARYGDALQVVEAKKPITLAPDQPFIIDTSKSAGNQALAESREQ